MKTVQIQIQNWRGCRCASFVGVFVEFFDWSKLSVLSLAAGVKSPVQTTGRCDIFLVDPVHC